MKKRIVVLFMAAIFILTGTAFALTEEEYKTVQKVANEYMSNMPADGYHILADDVLKRV